MRSLARLLSRLYHSTRLCGPCRAGAVWLGRDGGHVLRENRRVRAGILTPRDRRILH